MSWPMNDEVQRVQCQDPARIGTETDADPQFSVLNF